MSQETSAKDEASRIKEKEEQDALPYKWKQTISDLDITFAIPSHIRGKDVEVELKKDHISAGIKGEVPVIEGPLSKAILVDDCTWTVETGLNNTKEVVIHLEKSDRVDWWAHVVTTAPKIDTSKIVPEDSKISDLDSSTRSVVEKMMAEQSMKAKGQVPSFNNSSKMEAFERFKKEHPEMDFSKAKIG